MNDPIDWPAMGMPAGVEVEFSTSGSGTLEWSARQATARAFLWVATKPRAEVSASGIFMTHHFPILEALMRAARAIEAGEVELGGDNV